MNGWDFDGEICDNVDIVPPTKIRPYLYLGDAFVAHSMDILLKYGITHILNVADDVDNLYEGKGFEYCSLKVKDFEMDEGISRTFNNAIQFMKKALASGENNAVLVHCLNGSNRSVTIIIFLLMELEDKKLKDVWVEIKSLHPKSSIGITNRMELIKYENEKFNSSSIKTPHEFYTM